MGNKWSRMRRLIYYNYFLGLIDEMRMEEGKKERGKEMEETTKEKEEEWGRKKQEIMKQRVEYT